MFHLLRLAHNKEANYQADYHQEQANSGYSRRAIGWGASRPIKLAISPGTSIATSTSQTFTPIDRARPGDPAILAVQQDLVGFILIAVNTGI